jgi:hypothetical protein
MQFDGRLQRRHQIAAPFPDKETDMEGYLFIVGNDGGGGR